MTSDLFDLDRRNFLTLLGLGSMGFHLPGCGAGAPKGDAIVIGSGFGGAVAALRLGQAGIPTRVVERGMRWPIRDDGETFTTSLNPDWRAHWFRTEALPPLDLASSLGLVQTIDPGPGVLEVIEFENLRVYAGAAVGGGSVVYGGMTVQPTRDNFNRVFPEGVDYDDLDETYFPRVRHMLQAVPVPEDLFKSEWYLAARIARDQAAAAGIDTEFIDQACDWAAVRGEIDGTLRESAIVSDLIYGGNSGYKNSLDRNYIPAAEATGSVEVQELTEVVAIRRVGEDWQVDVRRMDETGDVVDEETLTCRFLIMAAGAVHTTRLLLEAQARGDVPNLPDSLGQGFANNGNGMFMRSGLDEQTGPQANPPVVLHPDFDNPIAPTLVEHAPIPPIVTRNGLLHLGVVINDLRATLYLDSNGEIASDWPQGGSRTVVEAIHSFVDRLNDANGGELDTRLFPEGVGTDLTYHPLGGCVIGETTDLWGRVKGQTGLYVVDGALLPGASGAANPALLISALAERCMDRLIPEDFLG